MTIFEWLQIIMAWFVVSVIFAIGWNGRTDDQDHLTPDS